MKEFLELVILFNFSIIMVVGAGLMVGVAVSVIKEAIQNYRKYRNIKRRVRY